MPPKRIMYTRHNMSIAHGDEAPEPSDSQNIYANKRRKPTPPTPEPFGPRSHVLNGGGRPRSSTTASRGDSKKTGEQNSKPKKFGGPISVPDDATGVDDDDPFKSTLNLAKARSVPKVTAGSLYGGGRSGLVSFSMQLKDQKREQLRKAAPVHYISDDSSVEGGIALGPNATAGSDTPGSDDMSVSVVDLGSSPSETTMRGGDRTLTAVEASERIFAGREYTAPPTAAPARTLWGASIHPDSDLATTWTSNQATSPLLRLPLSVRRKIATYALSSHSIYFNFLSYRNVTEPDGTLYSVPIGKYISLVYHGACNPLSPATHHDIHCTIGLTLLNSVCRQLYHETHALPYASNDFYFQYNSLFNHVVMEDPPRWTAQQHSAFTSIVVVGQVPGEAILAALPNLRQVRVMSCAHAASNGWYDVVRRGARRELVRESLGANGVAAGLGNGGMQGGRGRASNAGEQGSRGKGSKGVTDVWWRR